MNNTMIKLEVEIQLSKYQISVLILREEVKE